MAKLNIMTELTQSVAKILTTVNVRWIVTEQLGIFVTGEKYDMQFINSTVLEVVEQRMSADEDPPC